MEQKETQVLFVISGNMVESDIQVILNWEQIYAVYYFRTGQEKYPIDMRKVSGHFNTLEELEQALRGDIWFCRQQQCHSPQVNIFAEKNQNEKLLYNLNDDQIAFLVFQLFVDILPHTPTLTFTLEEILNQCNALFLETTQGSTDTYRTLVPNRNNGRRRMYAFAPRFSQIIIQLHRRGELYKLLMWQKHLVDINERISHPAKNSIPFTLYRAQIVSEEDLITLQSSCGKLISFGTFFLATASLETARSIARQAANNGLKSIFFEIEVVKEADLVYVEGNRVMFRLGAVFRLHSIDLAPDGVRYIKIISAESIFHHVKEQFQFEVGTTLSWLTLVNYLSLLNRCEQAETYYEYLCQKLPDIYPEKSSLNINMGTMYTMKGNMTEAIRKYELVLKDIDLLSHNTNKDDYEYQTVIQFQKKSCSIPNTIFSRSTVLGNLADVYSRNEDYKQALQHYKNALELSTNQQCRHRYQQMIDHTLQLLEQTEV